MIDIDDLKDELDILKTEIEDLEDENDDLQYEIDRLEEEIENSVNINNILDFFQKLYYKKQNFTIPYNNMNNKELIEMYINELTKIYL